MVVAALALAGQMALAATCSVVKHGPQTEAEKALLAADYAKAETLFRADVAKTPADPDAVSGLVHALLRQQKVKEAADAVKAALAAAPASGAFLTLRGEVELRQGEPWTAEQTALAAYKADPCNPRTRLLYARVAQVSARFATAKQQFGLAHQFDPEDPEIRLEWLQTLPVDQRAAEAEAWLAAPNGEDPGTVAFVRASADHWKKLAGQPPRACKLVSAPAAADLPFIKFAGWAGHTRGFGLEMTLNASPARIEFGNPEGGLTVYRPLAERAGLKRITENEKPPFPGAKASYMAYADKLKIGGLEFHDCVLKVIDSGSPTDDGDGNLGFDIFGDFLTTVDFPMRKVQLAPLTPTPQDAGYVASLHTDMTEGDGAASPHPTDRLVAPEMKDYSQIYRAGRSLILPTALNTNTIKLFMLSIGVPGTNIAADLAKQVSKTHEQERAGPGPDAKPYKVTVSDEITFNFARFAQKLTSVVSTDTSGATRMAGMEIGGNIGANTYQLLILHLDYRDGLVKFEFIADRGYKFE
ncbi:MAG: hypothetical protein WCE75_12535 [Terracidiphilus sp.]